MSNQIAVFIDFENVALWAEQEFLDLELTPLMDFLAARGQIAVKKVYGDWSRFSRYREDLMNNAVDLIQIYSVRAGKNRADIRLALDAFEFALTHEFIDTFVIVSGDSDFGPLVNRLRERGRYTLGIGPRDVTHPLLIKACDEFIYLEDILEEQTGLNAVLTLDPEIVQRTLSSALRIHEQQGDLPVPLSTLLKTLMLLEPAFGQAKLNTIQLQEWLNGFSEIVTVLTKDGRTYAMPADFVGITGDELDGYFEVDESLMEESDGEIPKPSLRLQYRQIFNRLKMTSVDFTTRRDVLRDIYRELHARPGVRTTDQLLEDLCVAYEQQGLLRSKTTLRQIWQMGFRQRAFDYGDKVASVHVPVRLDEDVQSEADFVQRAESGFVYAVINAGLPLEKNELAAILLNDSEETGYIDELLKDLSERELIEERDGVYLLPGHNAIPFREEPVFRPILHDMKQMSLPDNLPHTLDKARSLAKTAMLQRSQDFAASARSYLCACKLQWEAVEENRAGATLEDLRWYLASYASVKAGELSQIHRDYARSRPYYLVFFNLVQEDDPLWGRMRGLINPMLSYYWINAWRELGLNMISPGSGPASPAEIAVLAATNDNQQLCALWFEMTNELAQINPGLLLRVISQIRLGRTENPQAMQVAETLEHMLMQ
ncbi:MAG: NYN domain-containing protein [Caldilineaceae bacterium]|nr:NYN domain-containing protein [Caldilineaceae bacterium]